MAIQVPTRFADVIAGPPASPAPDFWLIGDSAHYQDSARTTPATADGDPIGSATDVATTGPFHPDQATSGSRPTLRTALAAFKGHAGIQFASGQTMSHATAPLTNSRTKGTLMCAFRADTQSPPGGSVFATTQNQVSLINGGWRVSLNTAAGEYGTPPQEGLSGTTGGQIATVVYDGTQTGDANRLRFFRNLVRETLTYTGTVSATTYAGGQTLYLSREAAGGSFEHTLLEVVFWRGAALSDADRAAWENYLAAKYFTKTGRQLVIDGDSNGVGSPTNTANPWPKRLTAALGWSTEFNGSSVGKKLSQGTSAPLLALRDDWLTAQPYAVALGTNDLAVDHASLATIQGYFNTLKGKLANARYPIFALTIPAAGANIAGTDETTRVAYNSWLAGVSEITVVDVATALGTPPNANFEGDNLHLTDAGHDVVKAAVVAAIRAAWQPALHAIEQAAGRAVEQPVGYAVQQPAGHAVEQPAGHVIEIS